MGRLPRITGKQLIRALGEAEFFVTRIKGSHHFLKHADGRCTVVPVHSGEIIGPGLLNSILKAIEMEPSELDKYL